MGNYDDALRRRLSVIADNSEAQTTWEKIQAARNDYNRRQQEAYNWQKAYYDRLDAANRNSQSIAGNITQPNNNWMQLSNASGGSAFNKLLNQIGLKESSNNYGAVNRQSGAMGKYQIMPGNIQGTRRGWDYEALGRDVTTSQFMGSPEIQEQIARYKLQQYYQKYGAAGASIAWYAGPGAANKYVNSGSVSRRGEAGGYPSVYSYMQSIMGGL
jgi:hypothetical protein